MRKAVIFIVLALLLGLCAAPAPAYAIPALPHFFYGSVDINGSPARDGTQISATVDSGDVLTTSQNPVTTAGGSYGINSAMLLIQGEIPNGATITFHVTNENGTAIGGTASFEAGGGPTRKNLLVTIPEEEEEEDGVVGVGAPDYVETNLFGIAGSFRISPTGEILRTIEATSEDSMLTMTIPKGTIALDKKGNPLGSLEVNIDESPPDPPEGAHIIGLAYDFLPDGATFAPPITFTWSYDPDALPGGVAEENLVIAYYDEDKDEWVEVDCVVDTKNNTVTASVEHFTTFAIIGAVTPPLPVPPVAEEVEVVEEEVEEEVVEEEEEEVVPVPPLVPEKVPEEVPAPFNWWPLIGIIATVVLAALLLYLILVRRRAA